MRLSHIKNENTKNTKKSFKIVGIDDEIGVIKTLKVILEREGYEFTGFTDHNQAIESIKNNHYDLLILDFLLDNIDAKQVVSIIRGFNKDLYILLLTGHSESAPPMETLEKNDIQGYCTKSDDTSQLLLLVKSAFKSVFMMNDIKLTRNGLKNILKSVPEIYQLKPIDIILKEILKNLLLIIKSTDAFILVDNIIEDEESKKSFYKGIGKYDTNMETFAELFNPLCLMGAGSARLQMQATRFEEGVFFPLMSSQRESIGVMYADIDDDEDINLIELFSIQAASSINNAFLHSLLNIKNTELSKTYEIIRTRYEETIDTLRLTVDAKDEYTRGHSDRVSKYAVQIGKCFSDITQHDLDLLRVGGTFHDIGKIGTTDDILLSDKKLESNEYLEIQKHPTTGAKILSALTMFKDIVPLVMNHHERIDGKGYPSGLNGDQIPFLARILSVADAFDAMTTNRVYRNKLSLDEAILQLEKSAGTQFDAIVVAKFVELIRKGEVELHEE